MKNYILCLVVGLLTQVMLDCCFWFVLGAKRFYAMYLGHHLAPKIYFLPAFLSYLLCAVGITFFVVMPLMQVQASSLKVFSYGVFFGLLVYGIYNFSNQATLANWPTIVVLVDTLWGGLSFGFISYIAYYLLLFFKASSF